MRGTGLLLMRVTSLSAPVRPLPSFSFKRAGPVNFQAKFGDLKVATRVSQDLNRYYEEEPSFSLDQHWRVIAETVHTCLSRELTCVEHFSVFVST